MRNDKTETIGIEEAVRYFRSPFRKDASKRVRGRVAVIAGSRGMSGAAALCAEAAMRSGAGLSYLILPASCLAAAEILVPEAVKLPVGEGARSCFTERDIDRVAGCCSAADAVVIGPGLGRDARTGAFVRGLLADPDFAPAACVIVTDADGLWHLGSDREEIVKITSAHPGKFVFTPHEGEAARLLGTGVGEVAAERRKSAAALFELTSGGVAVLKGSGTLVAAGGESGGACVFVNVTGNPALATGGSGDVLAGVIGGMAASAPAVEAAEGCAAARPGDCHFAENIVKYAVALHGLAGDLAAGKYGGRWPLARDIIRELGEIGKDAGQYKSLG